MRSLFFGSNGLRAGWRLLIYAMLVVLPVAVAATVLSIALHPSRPITILPQLQAGVADPVELGTIEGLLLLCTVFATAIMARSERQPYGAYGVPFRFAFRKSFWIGALSGFAALSLSVAISLIGTVSTGAGDYVVEHSIGLRTIGNGLVWGCVFVIVGLAEESFFRGYALHTLAKGIRFWPAVIVTSLVFLVFHTSNAGESALGLGFVLAFGLFAAFTLWLTGNLWFAIGFHAAWDWAMSFFYGVPNSGLSATHNFLSVNTSGPQWLTGGASGPEASVVSYGVLALAALAMFKLRQRTSVTSGPSSAESHSR